MSLVINTNLSSMKASNHLTSASDRIKTSSNRLSSGERVNSAKDDAAGLAIATRFKAQSRGLEQANRNATDNIAMLQIMDGALGQMGSILHRQYELAIAAGNGTYSDTQMQMIDREFQELKAELNSISHYTSYNKNKVLIDATTLTFQVGDSANAQVNFQTKDFNIKNQGCYMLQSSNAGKALMDAQTITINGNNSATIGIEANESAHSIADKITSQQSVTGVIATAHNNVLLSSPSNGPMSFKLSTDIGSADITIGSTGPIDIIDLKEAINKHTHTTGLSAKIDNNGLILKSNDGYNIALSNFIGTGLNFQGNPPNGDTINLDAVTTATETCGVVNFIGSTQFSVSSDDDGTDGGANDSIFFNVAANINQHATLENTDSASIHNVEKAEKAQSIILGTLHSISSYRAEIGAMQNRLQAAKNYSIESQIAFEKSASKIIDVDMASEMSVFTKEQIITQAGTSVLAHSNEKLQNVLALIGN